MVQRLLMAAALLLGLGLLTLPAQAGLLDRLKSQPDSEPAVAKPSGAAPAEQATGPQAPALFPDGLPVVIDTLPPGLANLSAQGCNACHYQVHDDWAESAHRGAWVEQPFRQAAEATGNAPVCLSCHLPIANQQDQLVVEYLGGPLTTAKMKDNRSWDPTLQQEGVTCAACHVRDGVVVGTRASEHAPHPVAVSQELSSPELCATCHQLTWPGADKPFYNTYGEWSESKYAAAGVRCQDCHMPPTSGLVTAGRFSSHASHAITADPARALSVLVDVKPGAAVRGQALQAKVTVQNTGAGHSVPTGSPFVAVVLEAVVLDGDGEAVGEPFTHRFERVVSEDPPYATLSDSRLAAQASVIIPVSIDLPQKAGGGAGALELRLRRVGAGEESGTIFVVQRIPLTVY